MRSFNAVILWVDEGFASRAEEGFLELDDLDDEGRSGASFSSSLAKLRSLGPCGFAFLGLVATTEEVEEGFDEALEALIEGAGEPLGSSSSSLSSARRRKFLALLPDMAIDEQNYDWNCVKWK